MASSTIDTTMLLDYLPAVVQWRCPYTQTVQYLDQTSFRAIFDEVAKTAYFNVRIAASFTDIRKTPLFLPIPPSQIADLQHTESPELPEPVKKAFLFKSDPAACLRFVLAQPSVVHVPSNTSLVPRNKAFGNVLERVQSLAHATDFTVFFPINDESFKRHITTLCSIIGSLSPVTSELDLASKYSGRGARVLEDCNFGLASAPEVVESPPSYDELAGPPEPSRFASNPKSSRPAKKVKSREEPWEQAIRELRSDMQSQLQALETRLEIKMKDVTERLESRIDERCEQLRTETQEHVDELDGRLEDVREDVDDLVDVRLEDRIDGAKEDLRDFVRDEVKFAGEEIRKELEGARLMITYD
ncbi:hypothetical protein MPH_03800 [Macrophomina phaseolina MS6]|uniref:Uncharacterized protein n=1 Tax=Macrophomina phaseolina (strain MS6) TaxID=1126212 RepID=K2R8Y6_MACPH|nr:hypothetical protein MPH_03800 [Macrophomina phaseolina MS6]